MEDCKVIGEGLKGNQVLMGLHMEGNWSDIDAHGYMIGATDEDGNGSEETGSTSRQSAVATSATNTSSTFGHTFTRILPWAHPKIKTAGEIWEKVRGAHPYSSTRHP
jgi:hypothetical protein